MATYKVLPLQNIYDVSLYLYGTIEGVFDLLISNPWLGMNTELQPGTLLEYHPYFMLNDSAVEGFKSESVIPANGERGVYYKDIPEPVRITLVIPPETDVVHFAMSGTGRVKVDWDDNSAVETVELGDGMSYFEHYYDDTVNVKRAFIHGAFSLDTLDISGIDSEMYVTGVIDVRSVISHASGTSLRGFPLLGKTDSVDLRHSTLSDLTPLAELRPLKVDLRNVEYLGSSVLDGYLEAVAANCASRRSCEVLIDGKVSSRGMAAINRILTDSENKWKFIINDTVYTNE